MVSTNLEHGSEHQAVPAHRYLQRHGCGESLLARRFVFLLRAIWPGFLPSQLLPVILLPHSVVMIPPSCGSTANGGYYPGQGSS